MLFVLILVTGDAFCSKEICLFCVSGFFFRVVSPVQFKTAQHSVHPTGGSRRVFRQFAWLGVGSGKMALSRPAHQRVTHTVSLFYAESVQENSSLKDENSRP